MAGQRRSGAVPAGSLLCSEQAIERVPTLRLVFHLAPRRAEAFNRAVLRLPGLALPVSDHNTSSRRDRTFAERRFRVLASAGPIRLVLDSTGRPTPAGPSGRHHLQPFLDAHDHARRRETLRGLAPCELIGEAWTDQPSGFTSDPSRLTLGPNT